MRVWQGLGLTRPVLMLSCVWERGLMRMRLSRLGALLSGALLMTIFMLGMAGSASAMGTEIAYTLDAPVPFSGTGLSGTLNPIPDPGSGPFLDAKNSTRICLAGVCDIQNQDWVIFTATVSGGWFEDCQLPLDTQKARPSLTASLM